ncbi:MAG TPA: hypothetical protein VIY07_14570 [Pseudolabrys sp.]
MIAKQRTDRFATSSRRPNVIADACRNACTAIIDDALSASDSIKQRSATRFIHPSVQRTAELGCTIQPPAAIKSP